MAVKKSKSIDFKDESNSSVSLDNKYVESGAMQLGSGSPYIEGKRNIEKNSKRLIAQHISKHYVCDFDAVLLDTGSTCEAVAEEIFMYHQYLTVLTNNLGAYLSYTRVLSTKYSYSQAKSFRTENELVITGGRYSSSYEALHGNAAEQAIDTFHPNVSIISVSGLRGNEGLFCHGSEERRIKELMCKKSTDRRIVAADWTKLAKRDAYAFQPSIKDLGEDTDVAVIVMTYPNNSKGVLREKLKDQIKRYEDEGIIVDQIPIDLDANS